ncbi:hypothetical protein [Desulfofarcimen acetoxidans]|uniref:hypothetical protein n=1 Tax=Desulfofarcimen acetoxidans TaxID=58138 RepID=UPI00019E655A|nr:hypothetical protein [Desulfofarcimen acetoxidans]
MENITVEKFIVQNHPLDEWTPLSHFVDIHSTGKTSIYVFMVDNKAIGGYSRPVVIGKNKLGDEMIWSIDGKQFSELNPYINFEQWKKSWQEKF